MKHKNQLGRSTDIVSIIAETDTQPISFDGKEFKGLEGLTIEETVIVFIATHCSPQREVSFDDVIKIAAAQLKFNAVARYNASTVEGTLTC